MLEKQCDGKRKNRVISAHCHDVHNSLVNQSSCLSVPTVIFLLLYFYTIIIFDHARKNLNIFGVEGLNLIDTYCNYKDENTQNVLSILELSSMCPLITRTPALAVFKFKKFDCNKIAADA